MQEQQNNPPAESALQIHTDIELQIAIGRNRRETQWRNVDMRWSEFVARISDTHRTAERYTEYIQLPKSRQDEIKDVGGFVGGLIAGGRRKNQNIMNRQLLTLDIDNAASLRAWEDYKLLFGAAAAIYSTHKHRRDKPRYRLIVPLDRPVFADEYVAIGRYLAGQLGVEQFDPTTYEPARLMFWPSTAADGEFIFDYQDGPILTADGILAKYKDWRNIGEWAYSPKDHESVKKEIKKQGDPLQKPGVIGAFCRSYNIHDAIETFLTEEYIACDVAGRYTYTRGSTAAGLVVYDDVFAFSHHGTDPAGGKLCNAFDLVRLHKFGLRDEDAKEDTPSNKLPSYTAMLDFVRSDELTVKQLFSERLMAAREDFGETEPAGENWQKKLVVDRKGNIYPTIDNALIILENDRRLAGKLAMNEFTHREVALADLPWAKCAGRQRYLADGDDSSIRHYLEKYYGLATRAKTDDALRIVMAKNSFHPVRQYLESLVWDGAERLETIFIDYLGAKDSEYVRVATKTAFTAAVARIFEPGIKFDYVLTLVGDQGIGKSSIFIRLGKEWFSDSLTTVQGKDAYEQLQGAWIIELGELASLKKAELESTKQFITKQVDRFRVAYGRRVEDFPRQCVFFGTTNKGDFLKDDTGNRRWWPIDCRVTKPSKQLKDFDDRVVDQVWAEAIHCYRTGHPIYLPREIEEAANSEQLGHLEDTEKTGYIKAFLDKKIPENWSSFDLCDRRMFLHGNEAFTAPAGKLADRDKVCIAEIWCELFEGDLKNLDNRSRNEIRNSLNRIPGWERYRLGCGKLRFSIYDLQYAYIRTENNP